ncbi:hypothetical protein DMP08_01890 [Paraeggerthella hongkongensis]|uniref:Uncharacterized protein n=1 Tax=Paraeggerthella hongkongensis TaxID=230658 RepID=A0A3N0BJD7_9ACTN|nr:hypothetical protein DMP08_01890 [Paraeggerthella hongkongensis]
MQGSSSQSTAQVVAVAGGGVARRRLGSVVDELFDKALLDDLTAVRERCLSNEALLLSVATSNCIFISKTSKIMQITFIIF